MLFRTVYGPELEAIYSFCKVSSVSQKPINRNDIRQTFLQEGDSVSSQGVDDAISFLSSAGLLTQIENRLEPTTTDNIPFAPMLLSACRRIERQSDTTGLDSLFTLIIAEIFTKPNRLFVEDVHAAVNSLEIVQQYGGISKEKIQAWKRVMEFLGVGYRAFGGFICAYSPRLVLTIIDLWPQQSGTLQNLLEQHFDSFLPHMSHDGLLAEGVAHSLQFLAENKHISLYPLQDSPARAYLGGLRGIRRRLDSND
jgi:hypothetical protein